MKINFDINYINEFIDELETLPLEFNKIANYLKELNRNIISNLENEKYRLSRSKKEAEDDYYLCQRVIDNNKSYRDYLYRKLQKYKEVLEELQSLEAQMHSKLMQAERELQRVVDNKPNTVSMPQEQQGPVLRQYQQQYDSAKSVVDTIRSKYNEISRNISNQKTLIYKCEGEIDKVNKRIKELEEFSRNVYSTIETIDKYIKNVSITIDNLSHLYNNIDNELNVARSNISLLENIAVAAREFCMNIIKSYKKAILSLNPDNEVSNATFSCDNIESMEKITDSLYKLHKSLEYNLDQVNTYTYYLSDNVKTKLTLETARYVEYISNVINEDNESFIESYRNMEQTIRYIRQYLELEIN